MKTKKHRMDGLMTVLCISMIFGFPYVESGWSLEPMILGAAVSAQAWTEREADHRDRDSTVGVADGYRQSSVASTENSW